MSHKRLKISPKFKLYAPTNGNISGCNMLNRRQHVRLQHPEQAAKHVRLQHPEQAAKHVRLHHAEQAAKHVRLQYAEQEATCQAATC
jgi:hypothetical protein